MTFKNNLDVKHVIYTLLILAFSINDLFELELF